MGGLTDQASCSNAQEEGSCCLLELLPVSCWSLVVDSLVAKDLLRLNMASKSMRALLSSMPGLWPQAASTCLALAADSISNSSHNPAASFSYAARMTTTNKAACSTAVNTSYGITPPAVLCRTDQMAHSMLRAFTAVACTCQRLKPQLKPQLYLLPPWLGVQPGRARGFVRLEPALVNPALALSAAQVHWLSWGCLAGHDGGVFVSSCSSSPRSGQPCGFMAAVVINKQLVAELYLPRNSTSPQQWEGLLTAPTSRIGQAAAEAAKQAAAAAVDMELWISATVVLGAAPGADMAVRAASSGRSRHRGSKAAAVTWHAVHDMLMRCIADNASRCRAVRCTAVVPPGTASAADLELGLAQLIAAGAPVLDVRRLQYDARSSIVKEAVQKQYSLARTAATAVSPAINATPAAVASPSGSRSSTKPSKAAANQIMNSNVKAGADESIHWVSSSAGSHQLLAAQQQWIAATASVQGALSAALKQQCNSSSGTGNSNPQTSDDDVLSEALASTLQQLPAVCPQVQLLVLPILLPNGKVGMRLPGGKLSAPRLLSLNVTYLVQLRHVWDKLPRLRQVLLMCGEPMQMQQQHQPGIVSDGLRNASAATHSGRSFVRGVFSQQQLEQQWQHQAQQHQQRQWDEEAWFKQQVGEQRGRQHTAFNSQGARRQQQQQRVSDSSGGLALADLLLSKPEAASESVEQGSSSRAAVSAAVPGSVVGAGCSAAVVLPSSALEAVQGMVLSCMDRLPQSGN